MPQRHFFQTDVPASSSNAPTTCSRIPLSKEARSVLKERRQEASTKYRQSLMDAYATVQKQIQEVAGTHAKSVQRVRSDLHMAPQISLKHRSRENAWNAFCWKKAQEKENIDGKKGKDILQDLVQSNKEEYAALNKEEKELVSQLAKVKATKAKGFNSSARSCVNDVTTTVKVLENEIDNLRSRTGIEALLFVTRSSTDTPLTGISFATPGITEFLGTAFKLDKHEFLARMEGFAMQGLKGTADSYKKSVSKRRTEIRTEILNKLCAITCNKDAQMEWKHYWVKVVARYNVVIEGWPDGIPFKNLSVASSPLPALNTLLHSWQDGMTHWKKLTSDETDQLIDDMKARGEIQDPEPRRARSDRGKKRKRQLANADAGDEMDASLQNRPNVNARKRRRKAAITPATVESSEDEEYNGDSSGIGSE